MPTAHAARIRAFMQKAGQDTPDAPVIPDEETRILRAKLILEEALETVRALGVTVHQDDSGPVSAGEASLRFTAQGEVDLEGVVDGCADISVVTIGTLIAFGVDDEPILEEVDQANLRKFAPGSYRREDGKWMKPPGWTPPDILGVLDRQATRVE
jgi:predicted HAD superfamily Cof-like phosphohydrolase